MCVCVCVCCWRWVDAGGNFIVGGGVGGDVGCQCDRLCAFAKAQPVINRCSRAQNLQSYRRFYACRNRFHSRLGVCLGRLAALQLRRQETRIHARHLGDSTGPRLWLWRFGSCTTASSACESLRLRLQRSSSLRVRLSFRQVPPLHVGVQCLEPAIQFGLAPWGHSDRCTASLCCG